MKFYIVLSLIILASFTNSAQLRKENLDLAREEAVSKGNACLTIVSETVNDKKAHHFQVTNTSQMMCFRNENAIAFLKDAAKLENTSFGLTNEKKDVREYVSNNVLSIPKGLPNTAFNKANFDLGNVTIKFNASTL